MTRPSKPRQGDPTQPVARNAAGLEIDQWGLPVSGPARIAALVAIKKPDPNDEPDAWAAHGEAKDKIDG